MLWRKLNGEDTLKGCREGLTEKVIFKNWKRSRNESFEYRGRDHSRLEEYFEVHRSALGEEHEESSQECRGAGLE